MKNLVNNFLTLDLVFETRFGVVVLSTEYRKRVRSYGGKIEITQCTVKIYLQFEAVVNDSFL